MRAISYTVFALAVLAQWAIPLSQIRSHERTLENGSLIMLRCTAPDPYDLLRGRFLAVVPQQRSAPAVGDAQLQRGQEVFAVLVPGKDGAAMVSELSPVRPTSGDFIRVKVRGSGTSRHYYFDWPFDRFYLNERLAPKADKWFAENIGKANGIMAEVRVLNGNAVLEDLSLDGKRFREILKTREM